MLKASTLGTEAVVWGATLRQSSLLKRVDQSGRPDRSAVR
jgi:hypothetical protein